MDSGEERISFVKDFKIEIKVQVVAFLDEKQAGAKAVGREKLFLGLATMEAKTPCSFLSDPLSEESPEKEDLCDV
jgi:hypothetical protein